MFYSNNLEYINITANKYIHLWTQCPQVDTKFIDYSDSLHLSFLCTNVSIPLKVYDVRVRPVSS